MSVFELTVAIAVGILWGRMFTDLYRFLVSYPAQKRRNRLMRELVTDMKDLTDKMVADMNKQKATRKPRAKKVTTKKGKK